MAEQYSSAKAFGGMVRRFKHQSAACGAEMKFTIFEPNNATGATLYFLAGLTCTDENFLIKAGPAAFSAAAELGITIVLPSTSPPALGIKGESDNADISGKTWDFGTNAGFYLNATADDWKTNYNMFDYVVKELPEVLVELLPATAGKKRGVMGHSMGGHGALVTYLKSGGAFASCSAFAPICHPTACPWGHKAFKYYLKDGAGGEEWDATELLKAAAAAQAVPLAVRAFPILIDQGVEDDFLATQLHPHHFVAAALEAKVPVTLRLQAG
jgi:S-formylglutathione hydrolase